MWWLAGGSGREFKGWRVCSVCQKPDKHMFGSRSMTLRRAAHPPPDSDSIQKFLIVRWLVTTIAILSADKPVSLRYLWAPYITPPRDTQSRPEIPNAVHSTKMDIQGPWMRSDMYTGRRGQRPQISYKTKQIFIAWMFAKQLSVQICQWVGSSRARAHEGKITIFPFFSLSLFSHFLSRYFPIVLSTFFLFSHIIFKYARAGKWRCYVYEV